MIKSTLNNTRIPRKNKKEIIFRKLLLFEKKKHN